MSISSEISRISGNVSDALTAIANKGVTVPSGSNSDDLADLIGQISGGGTTYVTLFDEDLRMVAGTPGWAVYEYYLVPFLANQTYRITWNGVPYICETQVAPTSDAYDGYMVGNASIIGGGSNTGEPFIMYRQDFGDPDPNHVQLALESYATGTVHVKIELAQSSGGGGIVISDTTDAAGGTVRTITATDTTTLISKTVTQNGTYDPSDDNADGYSEIIVDVSGGGGTSWEMVYSGQINLASDWGGGHNYASINPFDETIALNSVWRVTWDNVQYECTATWEGGDTTEGNPYAIGNYTYDGGSGGNNEPFYMQKYWLTYLMIVGASGWHTVVIEKQVSGGGSTLVPKTITANGTYDPADDNADGYSEVTVNVSAPAPNLQAKTNISPTTSSQTIQADAGYDGLSSVQINAMPSGTAGTPTATKGTVSNHSVSVTPSVTNTTGYITGSTKTGTPVTVSASELVSGSETKTANGTYDVTNLASLVVNVSGGSGIGTLLNTTSIGAVSTTSTQAASLNVSCEVSGINSYDLLIVESSVNTKTNGRHAATVGLIFLTGSSSVGTKNGATVATVKLNTKLSSNGTATSVAGTTAYGIYPNSCSVSDGTATIPMYRRYNSTSTGTINGTYTARVYGVNLYNLIGG